MPVFVCTWQRNTLPSLREPVIKEVIANSGAGLCGFAKSNWILARPNSTLRKRIDHRGLCIFGIGWRQLPTCCLVLKAPNRKGFGLLGLRMDRFKASAVDSPCILRASGQNLWVGWSRGRHGIANSCSQWFRKKHVLVCHLVPPCATW